MSKPVLFATGHAPPDRHAPLQALAAQIPLELALYGGPSRHATSASEPPGGIVCHSVSQRGAGELAASGRYAAVIAGTGGRIALPAVFFGARRARVPFVFWAALWRHPRTLAHLASYPLLRVIYRSADAVVTYGEHVSQYVRARGAANVHVAPQAVDNAFWSCEAPAPRDSQQVNFLFVGRPAREKGLHVLREAWQRAALPHAQLVVVGDASDGGEGPQNPEQLRNFYARADVLVVPSIRTRDFLEPWGLVVNEAMNQNTAIIATDAVGAAAGGLVRHERTGIVVAENDPAALSDALTRLSTDARLRAALADAGARAVSAYTPEAWADGFARAVIPLLAS